MDDVIKCFDMDLAESLLERDGSLPDPVEDHPLGMVEVTYFERDVVEEAMELLIDHLIGADDGEDVEIAKAFLHKVRFVGQNI